MNSFVPTNFVLRFALQINVMALLFPLVQSCDSINKTYRCCILRFQLPENNCYGYNTYFHVRANGIADGDYW